MPQHHLPNVIKGVGHLAHPVPGRQVPDVLKLEGLPANVAMWPSNGSLVLLRHTLEVSAEDMLPAKTLCAHSAALRSLLCMCIDKVRSI